MSNKVYFNRSKIAFRKKKYEQYHEGDCDEKMSEKEDKTELTNFVTK